MNACVCAICGNQKAGLRNWFLIAENPWEDRVRIMHWENCLALSPGILSACGPAHVRELLTQWLNSEILFSSQKSLPPIFMREQADFFHSPAWELAGRYSPLANSQSIGGRCTIALQCCSPCSMPFYVLFSVLRTLQNELPDSEIFAEQNAYTPSARGMMSLAQSASA